MRFHTRLVATLLFGSGFCALVYQIGWLRDFTLIFGSSTAASAAVLGIFIGGLGLGSLLIGPRADRHPNPLLLYAQLEATVAVSAAVTPFLLALVRVMYLAGGGSARLGSAFALVMRLVLSAIVLAIPTMAQGATLPAAARAATRDADVQRQDVAALYGVNALGAVVGCLIATFWLLERLGTSSTLWVAAAINLLVAIIAGLASYFARAEGVPLPVVTSRQGAAVSPGKSKRRGAQRSPLEAEPLAPSEPATQNPGAAAHPGAPVWFLLTASAVVGFAFFVMELVWYRMLGPLLGGSVFTFGLVLGVALAGIGAGGVLYALVARDKPASLALFGSTCLLEASAIAATYALGDRVAVLALALFPLHIAGFGARIVGWTIVTLIVVIAPALVAGYQFPLLISLFGRGRHDVGRQVGLVYAANTLGAIAGSLAGGFWLLPWLSATGTWRAVALVLAGLGTVAIVMAIARRAGGRPAPVDLALPAVLAASTIAFVMTTGPTGAWRHSGVGSGRLPAAEVFASPNRFHEWGTLARHGVVWEGDGTESAIALIQNAAGYAFLVNGKSDGSARGDAGTEVMLGLLGALVKPDARRALVIGLGTGSTAGWLGAVPSIERVDVVELEPLVVEIARACAPANRDVLRNPRVHVTIGDAREALMTTRDRYDIVASEPSNPYRAGVASLFTLEYYQAVADRLTDDGAFVQWVQGYEIDAATLRTIYGTLGAVFPQVETWYTNPGDLVLVASRHRHSYQTDALAQRIATEPFKSALANTWRALDLEGLLGHYVANDSLARRFTDAESRVINTDDRNVVEFGLARSVGVSLSTIADVRNAARAAGAARPPLDNEAAVRWPGVETALISYNTSVGVFTDVLFQGPPAEQARQAALFRYYRDNDPAGARALWERQSDPARDLGEMAMLADVAVGAGTDAALPFIDQLRAYQPGEADAILATLRLRQQRLPAAAAAAEAALARFRVDPWAATRYMERAVQIAEILAARDRALARRMFDAIGQPFSVDAINDTRLVARAGLTRLIDFPGLCGDAVAALEPDVPWNEGFLRLRRDCYQATNNRRLALAVRDLEEFTNNAAQALIAPSRAGKR